MNFSLSDDHQTLKDSARVFLNETISLKPLLVPGATVADAGYAANWTGIARMGWAGLMIPEEYGGSGLSCLELVMIVEEMGRTLAPSPFLGTLLGCLAILAGGSEEQRGRLLPRIAEGELTLAVALAEPGGREDGPDTGTSATRDGDRWRLTGAKTFVVDAAAAGMLVVTARVEESDARRWFLIGADEPGVTVSPLAWRDITRQVGEVTLAGARGELLEAAGQALWPWLRDRALLVLAAENAAGHRHVLDGAADYARQRIAFGRPIGAYQAIKHALADMLGQAESARAAVLYAAWALAKDDSRGPLAAAMAKAYSSDAYVEAAQKAIQIFGAIGFTWEMENHLYLKRAISNAQLFGDAAGHRARVIDLALAEAA